MNYNRVKKRTQYNIEKKNKMDNYTFLNTAYCKPNQTVLIGDSITEIYNHTELFAYYRIKNGIEVYNRGISGDTSDRLLERIYDNALNISPKNMVLLIGTNDLSVGADTDFIKNNINEIIERVEYCCPGTDLILLGVYPVGPHQGRRKNSDILALNKKLAALAEKKDVKFLDLTYDLSDGSGFLNKQFTYDGLHLNAKGFEIVTEKLLLML